MAHKREPRPFGHSRTKISPPTGAKRQQEIPEVVAQRMARRIAISTGLPTLAGMGVFLGSYLLVSRGFLSVPPGVTLLLSGACFLLGLLGLSYGVLSASWEEEAGSWLGMEHIGLNLARVRTSFRAMRDRGSSDGPQR